RLHTYLPSFPTRRSSDLDIVRDLEGHSHPGPAHDAKQTLLRIVSDTGIAGYAFGAEAQAIQQHVKPALLGADPFYRERLWQMLRDRKSTRLNSSHVAISY